MLLSIGHRWRIMILKLHIVLVFGLFYFDTISQVLPTNRSVDWSIAGLRDTTTVGFNVYNALNEGFVNDGINPNDLVFADFFATHPEPLILFFPTGNYLFNESIEMRSNLVIRGAGATETSFDFDLSGSGHSVKFIGSTSTSTSYLLNDAVKDETTLNVLDGAGFNAGDWIHLTQDDSDLVTSSWGIGTVGQIMKVNSIQNNTFELASEFRMTYDLARNPMITRFIPIRNAGIECIRFNRTDNTAPEQSSILFFQRAVNCWVKGVESTSTTYSHFEGRFCSNLSVTNSFFHHAFDYGGGGRAYGVMLHFSTNECLVYHNTFEHLRHSMIVQAGANGNVFAYNRSIDPYWDEGIFFPSNSAGDMVLHGNFPFANLFEQNDGQNIVIDNSHGGNGPFNTFFRNRASLFGIFFSDNTSPSQNLIGNEIPNTSAPYSLVNYNILGPNHFIFGNNNKGSIDPVGTDQLPDETYYLSAGVPSEIPSIYFASFGPPNILNEGTITTTIYADNSNYFAGSCNTDADLGTINHQGDISQIIYPNPANLNISIKGLVNYPAEYQIVNLAGKLIQIGQVLDPNDKISVRDFDSGIYILHIKKGSFLLFIDS